MATILVEIAAGELFGKITILEIKTERIKDEAKLRNIHAELETLQAARAHAMPKSEELNRLGEELKKINETLWRIEDDIREHERVKNFGPTFVELARA